MSSDTPRTDAITRLDVSDAFMADQLYDLCQALERELTAAQAKIAELEAQAKADAEDGVKVMSEPYIRLGKRLVEARKETEVAARKALMHAIDVWELTNVTNQDVDKVLAAIDAARKEKA